MADNETSYSMKNYKYFFSREVAEAVGVEKATLMEYIAHGVEWAENNQKNFHDGYYCTYNSCRAMTERYSFWKERKINRMLKELADDGYIIRGNYNKVAYDRTLWYTLSTKGAALFRESIGKNGKIDSSILTNRLAQSDEPIPLIYTNKKDIDTHIYEERFNTFWKEYPKKKDVARARKAFMALKPSEELTEQMVNALRWQRETVEWKKSNGQYIPNGATWIHGERWLDEKSAYRFNDEAEDDKDNPLLNQSATDFDVGGFL